MATKNDTSKLPNAETKLAPREYLNFLHLLEDEIPSDTRAYMVTREDDGSRRVQPVKDGSSVLNIYADLTKHLDAGLPSAEWLRSTAEYSDDRLGARNRAQMEVSLKQVDALLGSSIQAILSIRDLASKGLETRDNEYILESIRLMSSQVGYMIEAALEKATGKRPGIVGGPSDWMLPEQFNELEEADHG